MKKVRARILNKGNWSLGHRMYQRKCTQVSCSNFGINRSNQSTARVHSELVKSSLFAVRWCSINWLHQRHSLLSQHHHKQHAPDYTSCDACGHKMRASPFIQKNLRCYFHTHIHVHTHTHTYIHTQTHTHIYTHARTHTTHTHTCTPHTELFVTSKALDSCILLMVAVMMSDRILRALGQSTLISHTLNFI